MKKFKKIYIEITNSCNLKCKFCIGNKRKKQFMTFEEFKLILSKIKPYTDYIYLHILGEPLMHPCVNEFIDYAYDNGFNVNLTTNGCLIDRIKTNNIRQLNISLHSYSGNSDLNLYLDSVFNYIDKLDGTYVSLRMWVKNKYYCDIINYISDRYKIRIGDNFGNIKLLNNVYLNEFHEFIWPDLDNNYYSCHGKCFGLIDHIGILVDGTIVPCCLDSSGIIKLGNVFIDNISDVLIGSRVEGMIKGFKSNKKVEELCRHCNFLDK